VPLVKIIDLGSSLRRDLNANAGLKHQNPNFLLDFPLDFSSEKHT
jgi:hypothetical protein